MKLITSTGFFNTGSSAVIHILSEYNLFQDTSTYEVRILYDSDCISDLEYNLVENSHRHNTSNAIKRFKRFVDFYSNSLLDHHYEKAFHGQFKQLSYNYIDSISEFKYYGEYYGDSYNRGKLFWFINRCYQKLIRIVFKNGMPPSYIRKSLISTKEVAYAGTMNQNKFLNSTKDYVRNLLTNISNNNYVLIDQFFPPSNVGRYLKYIPDDIEVKCFIVDRDPIDLFLLEKYFNNNNVIPVYDVNKYCEWYLWTRNQSTAYETPDCVMRLQFEDLIYKYEETRNKILEFVGLKGYEACKQYKFFDPKKSVNNTQVLKRLKNINNEEIDTIRKRLKDYLYKFPEKGLQPDYSSFNMFEC